MPPMKGNDRHLFFRADANVRIIVKDREKIDVEWSIGRFADLVNQTTEQLRRRKADADCANSPATADRQCELGHSGESHARTGKGMLAAKPSGKPCRNGAHVLIPFDL